MHAIRLVPNSRSHPFHLQIIRSLLHLTKHTQTYIPISTHLVPILVACLVPSARPKSSTLRPLDFDVNIRVPQQYVKTRVLSEVLTEETVFLLAEWLASAPVHGSIAFPEIIVPITILLRKSVKNAKTGSAKEGALVKVFVERVEESAKWMEQKRKGVQFAPGKLKAVHDWEDELKAKLEDSPLGKYVKVQRKTREKRRKLVEKVCIGRGLMEWQKLTVHFYTNRLGKAKTRFWRRIERFMCCCCVILGAMMSVISYLHILTTCMKYKKAKQ